MNTVVKITLSIFFSVGVVLSDAQSTFELLGDADAIILDMKIDESRKLMVACSPNQIQVWNYANKTLIKSWTSNGIHALDYHHNSLAGVTKSGELYLWDMIDAKEIRKFKLTSSALMSLTWMDSVTIAAGSDDGLVYRVNIQTQEIKTSGKIKESITALEVDHTGNLLMAGGSKGTLVIYDLDFKVKNSFKAHSKWIRDIQLFDSTASFVTVSDDKIVKRWNQVMVNDYKTNFHGSWIISVDIETEKSGSKWTTAVGTLNGTVIISGYFGIYSGKSNASINKITLLKTELPKLKAIVATHGGGIQLWDAVKMKFKR